MARVLVVDDEPAIRSLIRGSLERVGHTVIEAIDGPSGLQAAQAQLPHLVLLDVALPGLSGLEVCRRLRAAPRTAGLPILLLSGLAGGARQAGTAADDWISKPFTPDGIARRVEEALRFRREATARP